MDITTIANNISFLYALVLIIFLLLYIAFYKRPGPRKSSRK